MQHICVGRVEPAMLEDHMWKSCHNATLDMVLGVLVIILGSLGLVGNFLSLHVIR